MADYKCNSCGATFASQNELNAHAQGSHAAKMGGTGVNPKVPGTGPQERPA